MNQTPSTPTPVSTLFAVNNGDVYGSGNKLFLVTGRVPESDDDSAYLIRADSQSEAESLFVDIETDGLSDAEAEYHEKQHGTTCYVNSCSLIGTAMGQLPVQNEPPVLIAASRKVMGSGSKAWIASGCFPNKHDEFGYLVAGDTDEAAAKAFEAQAVAEHKDTEDIEGYERAYGHAVFVDVVECVGTIISAATPHSAG